MDKLDWRPAIQYVRTARAQITEWHMDEAGLSIDDILRRNFNIDVSDRRQLSHLIEALSASAQVLASVALVTAESPSFFGLDKAQANVLAASVLGAWATLTLNLAEHLPPEVQSGRLKRERIYGPPIDPTTFNWSALLPAPEQIERHRAWEQAVATTPGQLAALDRSAAAIREAAVDGFITYMCAVAQVCIAGLAAADLDPDEVPTEGALRFRDVALVTLYNQFPNEYRKLAEAN